MSALAVLLRLLDHLPLPLAVRAQGAELLGANQLWRDRQPHTQWQLSYTPLSGAWSGLELITAQEPSVDRLKTEFLACIDHELKSPLTSVIGIANLLNQQTLGELNQKQSRYIEMIHQSSRHLMDTINTIVDLAQAEVGHLQLERETIDLKSLCQSSMRHAVRWVEQTAWLNRQSRPQTLIELDLPEELATCIADPARLQQMLNHLLVNACKFSRQEPTEQGQTPTVVTLQVRSWGRWLALTVIDQGIGIPEGQQHLIFQKFQQVDGSLSRRYEGTGLGLVLARQLARLHGGDISFTSQAGQGSQFTVLLPHEPEQGDRHLNDLVLLGETQTTEIDHLIKLLQSAGYHVVIARNGWEAIEKMRLLKPIASLLSADLPLLTGGEVVQILKREEPNFNYNVAIAVSSAYSEQGMSEAVLIKPITGQSLSLFLTQIRQAQRIPLLMYIRKFLDETSILTLQGLGYRLIEAEDQEQANVLCQIWQPDLLIAQASWELPINRLEHLPCVLVSPNDSEEVLAQAVNDAITQETVSGTAPLLR